MEELTLEIVEGPGAGSQIPLTGQLTIGRAPDADVVVNDTHASRHHARVSPAPGHGAIVEDLGSSNGTFLNQNPLYAPAVLTPGDQLLVGVTLFQLRDRAQIAAQPSAVRPVPAALSVAQAPPPAFVPAAPPAPAPAQVPAVAGTDALDPFLDVNTKQRAKLAPFAILLLVAIVVLLYFGAT